MAWKTCLRNQAGKGACAKETIHTRSLSKGSAQNLQGPRAEPQQPPGSLQTSPLYSVPVRAEGTETSLPCSFRWRRKQTFVLLDTDASPWRDTHFDWASAAAGCPLHSLPPHCHRRRRPWNAGVATWELPLLIFWRVDFHFMKKLWQCWTKPLVSSGLLFYSNPASLVTDIKVLNNLLLLHVQKFNLTGL